MTQFNTGFVLFPDLTQLDFTGPYEVLSRLGTPASMSTSSRFSQVRTHVVAKTMDPVNLTNGDASGDNAVGLLDFYLEALDLEGLESVGREG